MNQKTATRNEAPSTKCSCSKCGYRGRLFEHPYKKYIDLCQKHLLELYQ